MNAKARAALSRRTLLGALGLIAALGTLTAIRRTAFMRVELRKR